MSRQLGAHRMIYDPRRTSFRLRQGMNRNDVPSNISSVEVEEGVTSIETNAFLKNEDLRLTTLSTSVESIEDSAFRKCRNLSVMEIPQDARLDSIGEWSFSWCVSLRKLSFPASLTILGRCAFAECARLTTVSSIDDQPCRLMEMGENCFWNCATLKVVDLSHCPDVLKLAHAAFSECNSLETVLLPPNLQTIGESAFYTCSSLREISFPMTMQAIETGAFTETGLEVVQFPSHCQQIGVYAFSGCQNLATIQFDGPAAVRAAMNRGTFLGCDNLYRIQLPERSWVENASRATQAEDNVARPTENRHPHLPKKLWPLVMANVLSYQGLLGSPETKQQGGCLYSFLRPRLHELFER